MTCAALIAVVSCSDVPNPYELVTSNPGAGKTLPYKNNSLSSGFVIQTIAGNAWSQGSTYTQVSGYSGGNYTASESWLVSPGIMTEADSTVLSFDYTIRYGSSIKDNELADYHQVLISADYVDDVTIATWDTLPFKPEKSKYSDWTVYPSGDIQIPQEYLNQPKVYIAFVYKSGNNQGTTTTWELVNFTIKKGVAQNNGTDEPTNEAKDPIAKGNGTLAAPYNPSQADSISNTLSSGAKSPEVYVKGYISKLGQIETQQYGNATYYISDDGTTTQQYEIYRGFYLDGAKFTSSDQIHVGDTVIVCGQLTKYNSTNEMAQGSKIVYLNGQTAGGDNPGLDSAVSYIRTTSVTDGEYLIAAPVTGAGFVLATGLGSKTYGYLAKTDATEDNNTISTALTNVVWKIKSSGNGYTIQDSDDRYIYMTGTFNSFNVSNEAVEGSLWYISFNNDGTANIVNAAMQKTIQYSANFSSFGAYAETTNTLPYLYVKGDSTNQQPVNPGTGDGTKDSPYNVAKAKSVGANNTKAWVKGYIVGYVSGAAIATGASFGVPTSAETEFLLADDPEVTDYTKCIPVQLPSGDIRNNLELSAHPTLYKKEVQVYGQLTTYFGMTGVKSTSCAILDSTVIGTLPQVTDN